MIKLLASSVVRLSNQGASHGYLYEIDLNKKTYKTVLEWNDPNINWDGRGGDRGLRGIVNYQDLIIVSSGKQILFLNKEYEITDKLTSHLFGDIHEMFVQNEILYITSTQYDLIVLLNLKTKKIEKAYHIKPKLKQKYKKQDIFNKKLFAFKRKLLYTSSLIWPFKNQFDFEIISDIEKYKPTDTTIDQSIHINSIQVNEHGIFFTGTKYNFVFQIKNDELKKDAIIPFGTHNVIPYKEGYIMNYTVGGKVFFTTKKGRITKKYNIEHPKNIDSADNNSNARPGWNRGLVINDNRIFIGNSPASINIIDLNNGCSEIIQMDSNVRNTIHGLTLLK